ncbi:MAG: hypothetical protein ACFB0C_02340 [Leptolyngbyaceae cyanobacterium]
MLKTSLAGGIALAVLAHGLSIQAGPYPDELGICYRFEGDDRTQLEPCVISAGYGTGAHYVTLHWLDGTISNISWINYCPEGDYEELGFCAYQVNDQVAEPYERNLFMAVTTVEDPDNLPCYRILETDDSVCYRFNP